MRGAGMERAESGKFPCFDMVGGWGSDRLPRDRDGDPRFLIKRVQAGHGMVFSLAGQGREFQSPARPGPTIIPIRLPLLLKYEIQLKKPMFFSFLTHFTSVSAVPRSSSTISLANQLYTHLQKNPNNPEKAFNSIRPKLDATCVNEVLKRCSLYNSQVGLRFFIWAGYYQSSYRHSSYMFSKACSLFKIRQNPRVVLDLIEGYRVDDCVVNVKMFKVVLNLCKEGGLANEALWVLRKMPEFDIRPDTNAYNMVIRLFCEKGDMDMAQRLMGEMGLIDLYPDMITYILVIKGLCNVGRLEEACALFKVMTEHGCTPNVLAYSTLLDGVCRFGSLEKALELLAEMEKQGRDCSPNVVTYTSVIQGFCERGRVNEALRVLDRMGALGCLPNRVTVCTLINGLCADGQLGEAYKLVDRVVAGGSVTYSDCYSSFVVCLIRIRKVEEAEKLFKRVVASGVRPDGLACSVIMKELCSQKRVLDGFCLYEEIEKLSCLSSIDSDIFSILLLGLCQQGHSVEAVKLAGSMLVMRIQIKAPYVDKIVEHLKKFGHKDLVKGLAGIGKVW